MEINSTDNKIKDGNGIKDNDNTCKPTDSLSYLKQDNFLKLYNKNNNMLISNTESCSPSLFNNKFYNKKRSNSEATIPLKYLFSLAKDDQVNFIFYYLKR